MYCANCGTETSEQANFCPACGARMRPSEQGASTTASIDLQAEHPEVLEDLPPLDPGTGMLVVVRGPSAGARFLLDRDVSIGRHPDADLFLDDVTVSRDHAAVTLTSSGPVLKDLGSLNGTYVSGSRVEEHALVTGDEVQVGRFKLVYVGAERA